MSNSMLGRGFCYETETHRRDGTIERAVDHNLLPQESVSFVAGLVRGAAEPISTWYVGLFEGNYVPTSDVTAAALQSDAVECTAYTEGARPEWVHSYDGEAVIDSLNNKAEFTFNAAKRVYGAFIISASTKGGNTGLILSIARFATPKDIEAGEVFSVAAGLTLIPTSL